MASYFIDSSGLVKRYNAEIGSAWITSLTAPAAGNMIFIARITCVEVVSAITRQGSRAVGNTSASMAAIHQFQLELAVLYRLIEINPPLIAQAMSLAQTHALRAYDAVQLAAAQEVHRLCQSMGLPAVTLISADVALNHAALAEGMFVDDPNTHP